jgi:hypothetical protein
MPDKAVLAGGSGFLGRVLARHLRGRGWEVVVLTRRPRQGDDGIREVAWDARSTGPWTAELSDATALFNLAGHSINCVHNAENRRSILESRLAATRALGAACAGLANPPRTWVQASAVGYYGIGEKPVDETAPAGTDWLSDVCRQWEDAFTAACPAVTRGVVLRLGVVLGREGGAYPPLARMTRWFLGGTAGSGRQGVSWIHLDDAAEIMARAAADAAMRGAYNACAPQPANNSDFMRVMRTVHGRPWAPPAPVFAVALVARWLLRADPSLALTGQFCPPARLEAAGYRFRHPGLETALADLAGRRG